MRAHALFGFPSAVLALALVCGCNHAAYEIVPLRPTDGIAVIGEAGGETAGAMKFRKEVLPGRLDGTWFQRNVYSGSELQAVELMYCPITKDGPTVCRTALVWQKGVTELLESSATSAGGTAAPPK